MILETLAARIDAKADSDPAASYTAALLAKGAPHIARKVGEEAVEAVIEAVRGDAAALTRESADLLYHLAVLWRSLGITPADIAAELDGRSCQSGLAEKASRPQ